MEDPELAISVASAGAAVVRDSLDSALRRFSDGNDDIVTSADLSAERAMLDILRAQRPGDALEAEESGQGGASASRRSWLVDPLCGTRNYSAGTRVVAVNIALWQRDGVHCAAVADPFAGDVLWTDGRTAAVRVDGRDTSLTPSAASRLVDLNLDPPFPSAPAVSAVALAAHPAFVGGFRPRVVSSSIALAWVASGQRAAYVTDGDVHRNVHFSAGLALCRAAGCVISDLRGGVRGLGALVAADARTPLLAAGVAQRLTQPAAITLRPQRTGAPHVLWPRSRRWLLAAAPGRPRRRVVRATSPPRPGRCRRRG